MNTEKLKISDFLTVENELANALTATIEPVNDKEVRITPTTSDGCNCSKSLVVTKDSIEFVEKTGATHYCCGKNHSVVKITFKKGASIPIEKVLEQLSESTDNNETPVIEKEMQSEFAMDENNIHSPFEFGQIGKVPCTPSHEIAQRKCFHVNPFTGKIELKGNSYLVVYTTPRGKICKREWSNCM